MILIEGIFFLILAGFILYVFSRANKIRNKNVEEHIKELPLDGIIDTYESIFHLLIDIIKLEKNFTGLVSFKDYHIFVAGLDPAEAMDRIKHSGITADVWIFASKNGVVFFNSNLPEYGKLNLEEINIREIANELAEHLDDLGNTDSYIPK
jgi:hypothetical protein